MKAYYKVGDKVEAFVLDYTDRGEINLTHYTDAEVEADGFDILDDDEGEVSRRGPHSERKHLLLSVSINIQ